MQLRGSDRALFVWLYRLFLGILNTVDGVQSPQLSDVKSFMSQSSTSKRGRRF
jgi:hypothetical protein